MKYFHTIVFLVVLGCSEKKEAAAPVVPAGRGESVQAKAPDQAIAGFCDVVGGAEAKVFQWPELAADSQGQPAQDGKRWINVWATWCRPCVNEMPLLQQWQERLDGTGVKVDLSFLSVDVNARDVSSFRALHPEIPETFRVSDAGKIPDLFGSIGLDPAAPIPVHIFVDDNDKILCVRAGSVQETDYRTIRAILKR